MNVEEVREYCLSLGEDVEEKMPFQAFKSAVGVLVFYVCGHMFCMFDIDDFHVVTVKCQPERIPALKEKYDGIDDPYNMSNKHWIGITVTMVSNMLLRELIKNSYELVKRKYEKRNRKA